MFVGIKNNNVTFAIEIIRGNNIIDHIGEEALYTKHGLFLPLTFHAFNFLDVLEGKTKKLTGNGVEKAFLFTPEGEVYDLTASERGSVVKRRVLFSKESIIHRSGVLKIDQAIATALKIKPEDCFEELYARVADDIQEVKFQLVTRSYTDILAKLEKFKSVPVKKEEANV